MHVQCANDAENILEESLLHRSDSIASVDETELKVKLSKKLLKLFFIVFQELEKVKDEPDVKQEMMETETADPVEKSPDDQVFNQAAETSMECVNSIVNEDQAEQSLEVKLGFSRPIKIFEFVMVGFSTRPKKKFQNLSPCLFFYKKTNNVFKGK